MSATPQPEALVDRADGARPRRRAVVPTSSVAVVAFAVAWWTEGSEPYGDALPLWIRAAAAAAVVVVMVALALLGRRRAVRVLGQLVVARRDTPQVTARVVAAYGLTAAVLAGTSVLVDVTPVAVGGWHVAGLLLCVVALSTVGVWTVVLDGSSAAVAVSQLLLVLPATILGIGAGLGVGFVAFFPSLYVAGVVDVMLASSVGAGDALHDVALWATVWFAGIWAGTLVSTYPVWPRSILGGHTGATARVAARRDRGAAARGGRS